MAIGTLSLAAFWCFGVATAMGGEVSLKIGSIEQCIGKGYKFVGGSDISSSQNISVSTTTKAPFIYKNALTNTGSLYLQKDTDLLICSYTIVTSNPAAGSQDLAAPPPSPHSACYRLK
jgi:hypothetical protein